MADLRVEMEEAKADSLSRVSSDAMMANVVGLLETAQDEINLRDDLLDAAVAEMRAERQRANDLEQEVAALIDINRMQVDAQKAAARKEKEASKDLAMLKKNYDKLLQATTGLRAKERALKTQVSETAANCKRLAQDAQSKEKASVRDKVLLSDTKVKMSSLKSRHAEAEARLKAIQQKEVLAARKISVLEEMLATTREANDAAQQLVARVHGSSDAQPNSWRSPFAKTQPKVLVSLAEITAKYLGVRIAKFLFGYALLGMNPATIVRVVSQHIMRSPSASAASGTAFRDECEAACRREQSADETRLRVGSSPARPARLLHGGAAPLDGADTPGTPSTSGGMSSATPGPTGGPDAPGPLEALPENIGRMQTERRQSPAPQGGNGITDQSEPLPLLPGAPRRNTKASDAAALPAPSHLGTDLGAADGHGPSTGGPQDCSEAGAERRTALAGSATVAATMSGDASPVDRFASARAPSPQSPNAHTDAVLVWSNAASAAAYGDAPVNKTDDLLQRIDLCTRAPGDVASAAAERAPALSPKRSLAAIPGPLASTHDSAAAMELRTADAATGEASTGAHGAQQSPLRHPSPWCGHAEEVLFTSMASNRLSIGSAAGPASPPLAGEMTPRAEYKLVFAGPAVANVDAMKAAAAASGNVGAGSPARTRDNEHLAMSPHGFHDHNQTSVRRNLAMCMMSPETPSPVGTTACPDERVETRLYQVDV